MILPFVSPSWNRSTFYAIETIEAWLNMSCFTSISFIYATMRPHNHPCHPLPPSQSHGPLPRPAVPKIMVWPARTQGPILKLGLQTGHKYYPVYVRLMYYGGPAALSSGRHRWSCSNFRILAWPGSEYSFPTVTHCDIILSTLRKGCRLHS